MLPQFENGEKCDGSKILAGVHMMQDFTAEEIYLRSKDRPVTFQRRAKNAVLSS